MSDRNENIGHVTEEDVRQREDLRALAAGKIGADGTRYGSADGHRAMIRVPSTSRRRCGCGCGKRSTHQGLGDGVGLMSGCEFYVRRWVHGGWCAILTRSNN